MHIYFWLYQTTGPWFTSHFSLKVAYKHQNLCCISRTDGQIELIFSMLRYLPSKCVHVFLMKRQKTILIVKAAGFIINNVISMSFCHFDVCWHVTAIFSKAFFWAFYVETSKTRLYNLLAAGYTRNFLRAFKKVICIKLKKGKKC